MPIRIGEQHPNAKLTNQQIMEIRSLWSKGHRNIKVIAINYNISTTNVKSIVDGKLWKHLL